MKSISRPEADLEGGPTSVVVTSNRFVFSIIPVFHEISRNIYYLKNHV